MRKIKKESLFLQNNLKQHIMLNHGKTESGTKINVVGGNYIMIHPETILTATITVRDKKGHILWQKENCTSDDICFALDVAKGVIKTKG